MATDVGVGLTEPGRKQIGGLFDSDIWWRDRYHDIGARGYRLGTRLLGNTPTGNQFGRGQTGQVETSSPPRMVSLALSVGILLLVIPALTNT